MCIRDRWYGHSWRIGHTQRHTDRPPHTHTHSHRPMHHRLPPAGVMCCYWRAAGSVILPVNDRRSRWKRFQPMLLPEAYIPRGRFPRSILVASSRGAQQVVRVGRDQRLPLRLATIDWPASCLLRCSLSVCRCRSPKITSTTRTTCCGHPHEDDPYLEHRACHTACAAGGQVFIAEHGWDTYRRAGPRDGCAHKGAGWTWRDMEMDVLQLGLRATG